MPSALESASAQLCGSHVLRDSSASKRALHGCEFCEMLLLKQIAESHCARPSISFRTARPKWQAEKSKD